MTRNLIELTFPCYCQCPSLIFVYNNIPRPPLNSHHFLAHLSLSHCKILSSWSLSPWISSLYSHSSSSSSPCYSTSVFTFHQQSRAPTEGLETTLLSDAYQSFSKTGISFSNGQRKSSSNVPPTPPSSAVLEKYRV